VGIPVDRDRSFWFVVTGDSGLSWPVIPVDRDRVFWFIVTADSGLSWPVLVLQKSSKRRAGAAHIFPTQTG